MLEGAKPLISANFERLPLRIASYCSGHLVAYDMELRLFRKMTGFCAVMRYAL